MRPVRKEYYLVYQFRHGAEPKFPLNDANMLGNLASGHAEALGHTKPVSQPVWGTGVYERDEDGEYTCIMDNYDTSG